MVSISQAAWDGLVAENVGLKARLAEAEAALALASQAIDERLSGLAGDPLQDVADAINRYYADSAKAVACAECDGAGYLLNLSPAYPNAGREVPCPKCSAVQPLSSAEAVYRADLPGMPCKHCGKTFEDHGVVAGRLDVLCVADQPNEGAR